MKNTIIKIVAILLTAFVIGCNPDEGESPDPITPSKSNIYISGFGV